MNIAHSVITDAIKSFEQFLRRNANLNADLISGSKRFCKVLAIMISFKDNKRALVRNELDAKNYIVYKNWLTHRNAERESLPSIKQE